ncbi:hypothetical protein STEG23_026072 [Scotinomys teguina]
MISLSLVSHSTPPPTRALHSREFMEEEYRMAKRHLRTHLKLLEFSEIQECRFDADSPEGSTHRVTTLRTKALKHRLLKNTADPNFSTLGPFADPRTCGFHIELAIQWMLCAQKFSPKCETKWSSYFTGDQQVDEDIANSMELQNSVAVDMTDSPCEKF